MTGAKKLINDPKHVVLEAIDGLVAAVPHLRRLDGYPGVRAQFTRDASALWRFSGC